MCGIVGAVAKRPVVDLLIEGLKKLEYRGYDSAGLALIDDQHHIHSKRVVGKVRELEAAVHGKHLPGETGVAHTRWATHGAPSLKNTHPFISHNRIALVHNGIIENYQSLRTKLIDAGYSFNSETDTETAVHLVHFHFVKTNDLLAAVRKAVEELTGAYAFGICCTDFPHRLIGVRKGAPLVIGKGHKENFIASDPLALLSLTKEFIYLEDNDIADIGLNTIDIYDQTQYNVHREQHTLNIHVGALDRGKYRHYMKKEIMEQPQAIRACLEGRTTSETLHQPIFGTDASAFFSKAKHVQLVACGTSYHAALVARYWIESLANVPCSVEIASEFRYRHVAVPDGSLFVALSQSGETADTLAALALAKEMGYLTTLAICNVSGSTMVRTADMHFLTRAGVEIGVASTKSFVAQLISLLLLALSLRRGTINNKTELELLSHLHQLPALIELSLKQDETIAKTAINFTNTKNALFIGRGELYPIALEGALKMKELSYIHAEGYPAGELKHGPLALVDPDMPIVAMAPSGRLLEKNMSNLHEVLARGGKLFIFTDQMDLFSKSKYEGIQCIELPHVHPLLLPIVYTVPMQLLAYHVAVLKGTDVDQPRNLAKSVTVE